jgi:redox-sensitive bicupin YhaK (pirin superfamily)
MITIYPYQSLGNANHGWLNARHHFSFASYYNPNRMGFGLLKVINDDIIDANSGFAEHPHTDMEIITYVRSGAITHKDSNGNEGRTEAGDIQVMSAGSGIRHSEYNFENDKTNIFQIWIEPSKLGVKPRWDSALFPKDLIKDSLPLLVSKEDDKAPLFIYQDAQIYGGNMLKDTKIIHKIKNQIYILISKGQIKINDKIINKGDGAEIINLSEINIESLTDSEILIIDVPSK